MNDLKTSAQPAPVVDVVSRADVLECFADLYDAFEDCSKGIINELNKKFEDLRALPSAQPERESDEWIKASVAGMPALYHEKCNTFVYAPNGKKGFNFCPNCGADMRGKRE